MAQTIVLPAQVSFQPVSAGLRLRNWRGESHGNPQHYTITGDKSFVDCLPRRADVRFGCGKPGNVAPSTLALSADEIPESFSFRSNTV